MSELTTITVTVNGTPYQRTIEPRMLLSDFLRHELGLTGTHVGCEHGVCGTCTVLLDGESVRSCLMFAVQAEGHEVTTVEALGTVENMHPLQEAFQEAQELEKKWLSQINKLSIKNSSGRLYRRFWDNLNKSVNIEI